MASTSSAEKSWEMHSLIFGLILKQLVYLVLRRVGADARGKSHRKFNELVTGKMLESGISKETHEFPNYLIRRRIQAVTSLLQGRFLAKASRLATVVSPISASASRVKNA